MGEQVKFIRLITCLLGFCLLLSNVSRAEWHSDQQSIMGTNISLTLWHTDKTLAKKAIEASMAELRRIDRSLSPYIESSELSKLNKIAHTKAQPISDEMLLLIDKSLYFGRISGGAFDITYASVGWHYDYREKKRPSDQQRESLLPAINYRLLDLDKKNKTLRYGHKNIRIDLGGVAKGYAVDRVANILSGFGITEATISAGGDSRILGDKFGKQWMIGIKNPRGKADEPAIVLPLANVAVSTSGDYERFFIDEKSGERIHHIINPRTGKSVKGIVSVTILGPQGIDTDPLSTTVFVLGVEKGLALVDKLPGFDCILIDAKGKVHYSQGLAPPKA